MARTQDEERTHQIVMGAALLTALTVVLVGLLVGWRFLPGLLGEWIGAMVGIATTPFFLEASLAMLGIFIVISLNIWRRHREGDEFVFLEQVTGPDVPPDLPEHARWVIYRGNPADAVDEPTLLEQAEGALAIGDHAATAAALGAMDASDLKQAPALRVRLALARATGREALAVELAAELHRTENHQLTP